MYANGDKAQMSANGDSASVQRPDTMENVLRDIVQVSYSGQHSVSGDWFISRKLMQRASDAIGGLRSYTTGVRYTPHIDRGPGFTHSDPAEECGCRFIGGNDPEILDSWECPISEPGCVKNCGDYGCGN